MYCSWCGMAKEKDAEKEKWLDEIVSLQEAAALRKVSIDTVYREIKRGRLKVLKLSLKRRGITRREALKGGRD